MFASFELIFDCLCRWVLLFCCLFVACWVLGVCLLFDFGFLGLLVVVALYLEFGLDWWDFAYLLFVVD